MWLFAPWEWDNTKLMIWCCVIEAGSVSSLRIVVSVIEPGPWCPVIGVPLISEMSTASPVECSDTLPSVVKSE